MSIRLRSDVSATDTDDGLVVLNMRTGRYWQLNSSAALVLRALLDGEHVGTAAQRLTRTYSVPADRAGRDAAALLDQLVRAELVAS